MAKYIKKPIVVDAVQWTGTNANEIINNFSNGKIFASPFQDDQLIVSTSEGKIICNIGDYIIREIKVEFYPCKSEIFEASYELVGDNDAEDIADDVSWNSDFDAAIEMVFNQLDNYDSNELAKHSVYSFIEEFREDLTENVQLYKKDG